MNFVLLNVQTIYHGNYKPINNIPYYFIPASRLLIQPHNDIHDFFQKGYLNSQLRK